MLIIQYQFCFEDDALFPGADLGHIAFHGNFILLYFTLFIISLC